jgi:hypothetical protein
MIKNNICNKNPLEKLKSSMIVLTHNHINTQKINNNNNILIIAKLKLFESQNSSNRLNFLNFLNTKNNIVLIEDSLDISIDRWIIENNWKPDIILYYFLSATNTWLNIKVKNFKNINIKKYMIFEDCIYTDTIKQIYNKYNFSKVLIPTYTSFIINFLNNNNINYCLFGYHIDTNIFKPLDNIEKKYDILYYGAHFLPVYPLRDKIYKVLKKLQSNSKYKIKIIEHISYDKNTFKLPMDEELCMLINQSRFCISTSSKYNLLLKKYIEIPLCGTTIIGNIPTKYKNELSGKMVNIDFNANENEIEKIILEALKNKYMNEENNTVLLSEYMKNNFSFDIGYNKLCIICNN